MKASHSRIISWMGWILLFSFAYFGIYMVKYKVQEKKIQAEIAERQLREEKKNLHVLAAEWTYLNRPARLRQLSDKYLEVKPMHGKQMADFASLPYPAAPTVASDTLDSNDEEGAPPLSSPIAFGLGANHGR